MVLLHIIKIIAYCRSLSNESFSVCYAYPDCKGAGSIFLQNKTVFLADFFREMRNTASHFFGGVSIRTCWWRHPNQIRTQSSLNIRKRYRLCAALKIVGENNLIFKEID